MLLGKLPRREDPRTLKLGAYLTTEPTPPPLVTMPDVVPAWPMYMNDHVADCTCAAAAHMVQAWTGREGKLKTPAELDVLTLYGVVNGGHDRGAVALDVLNAWRKLGLGSDKIDAYVEVNAHNHDHVKLAVWLFGGVYAGFRLPLTARSTATWDVGPNGLQGLAAVGSWGGHAVNVVAYDDESLTIITWGRTQRMTWNFWDAYVDECYAVLNGEDWLGDIPGLDTRTLAADLAMLSS